MLTRASARRTIFVGIGLVAVSLLMIFSPLLLGPGKISKTIVAFGLIAFCVGGSCILHGTWDWVMRR